MTRSGSKNYESKLPARPNKGRITGEWAGRLYDRWDLVVKENIRLLIELR
jgi:hypothetical protein